MKRSRQTTTPYGDLQQQFNLRHNKIKALQTDTLRWLDIQSFIDCNLRQHQLLFDELHQTKQQIQTCALKLPSNGELMALQMTLDKQRRVYREKSLRNMKLRLEVEENEAGNHQEEIEGCTKKIQEMSRELANLQDAQQRYRVVAGHRDFFEIYEKLCRECEKLRNQNQQLQLVVGLAGI